VWAADRWRTPSFSNLSEVPGTDRSSPAHLASTGLLKKNREIPGRIGELDMGLRKPAWALSLLVGTAGFAFGTATPDTQSAKQDMKDAGHDTNNAAKETGQATKKTANKKGTHKAAQKTAQGAANVEDKTR
jgi:hypothetical protein